MCSSDLGLPSPTQRTLMGSSVNPSRQAADDRQPGHGQMAGNALCHSFPIGGAIPGAYQRNCRPGILWEAAAAIEGLGGIIDIAQAAGIGRILPQHQGNARFLACLYLPGNFRFRLPLAFLQPFFL